MKYNDKYLFFLLFLYKRYLRAIELANFIEKQKKYFIKQIREEKNYMN